MPRVEGSLPVFDEIRRRCRYEQALEQVYLAFSDQADARIQGPWTYDSAARRHAEYAMLGDFPSLHAAARAADPNNEVKNVYIYTVYSPCGTAAQNCLGHLAQLARDFPVRAGGYYHLGFSHVYGGVRTEDEETLLNSAQELQNLYELAWWRVYTIP